MLQIRKMIETDCKYLETFNEETDEKYLIQWSGGKVYQYPITVEQIANRLYELTNIIFFTIIKEKDIVGFAELSVCDEKDKIGLVSRFILGKQYQGRGFGTESLKYIVEYAISEIGMTKVALRVYEDNTAAIKCYKKAGFIITKRYEYGSIVYEMIWDKRL